MLLGALVLGILAGYVRGGRLKRLENVKLRAEVLMLVALALQWLTPTVARALRLSSNLAFLIWLTAFAVLLCALWLNRSHRALVLAAAGVGLNVVVIAANGGMPVLPGALRVLGPEGAITPAAFASDPLYHLAGPTTRLPLLADTIPVPLPSLLGGVASIGDVVLMAGVFWFVQEAMCYRGKRRVSRSVRDADHHGATDAVAGN